VSRPSRPLLRIAGRIRLRCKCSIASWTPRKSKIFTCPSSTMRRADSSRRRYRLVMASLVMAAPDERQSLVAIGSWMHESPMFSLPWVDALI